MSEQRARQHSTEHERHNQPYLPMSDRGDNLTPIISLGLPLGDVAPQRLGGADPELLHGEECGRPQQGERREALLAEGVSTEALEREGQRTRDGEGRCDVDASGTRSLLYPEPGEELHDSLAISFQRSAISFS